VCGRTSSLVLRYPASGVPPSSGYTQLTRQIIDYSVKGSPDSEAIFPSHQDKFCIGSSPSALNQDVF
jgi:hypothetical protein